MLTRLKLSGFRRLPDLDVRFGPFTCIAGPNGSGKSSLVDAIAFLSGLARRRFPAPLAAGALALEAEMIVPREAIDELGQKAEASITFLRYAIELDGSGGSFVLEKEELSHITLGEARQELPFPHGAAWRQATVTGARRVPYFISTHCDDGGRLIKIHQDQVPARPRTLMAATLPRTALSVANSTESPTAALARMEMLSWCFPALDGRGEPGCSGGERRFAALAALEEDSAARLMCIEEPENGLDPENIVAVVRRLEALAPDCRDPAAMLRQVIVTTHLPAVTAEVHRDSVLIAEGGAFGCLPDTWRARTGTCGVIHGSPYDGGRDRDERNLRLPFEDD